MKKNLNKLATLALTGILMTGMSFGALADWSNTSPALQTSEGKAVINKWIKVVNYTVSGEDVGTDVPDVTYSYSVDGTTKPGKIGDYQVEKGIGTPTASPAAFSDSLSIDKTTKKVMTTFTVDFSGITFTNAGVYRYTITETNPTCADITAATGDGVDTYYLDVYVDAGGEITNYVLLNSNEDRTGNANTDKNVKLEGIDDGDQYNTYDLVVKKVISGNDSVKGMSFNFDVDLERGANGVENVKHNYFKNTNNEVEFDGTGYGTVSEALTNNETITIKNVPASATVKVKETNTTVTAFDVSLTGATFIDGGTAAVLNGGTSSYVQTDTAAIGGEYKEIVVTNTYNSVPVTGVVMDIAPYAAMILGAGAFAGVFLGKKKSEDEE